MILNRCFYLVLTLLLTFLGCKKENTNGIAYAEPEEWYLRTGDRAANLFIREIGQGEPVIVLHGGPGMPHDYMLDISEGLTDQYRFVFYDQRGSRSSPLYQKDSVSIYKHVEDLESIRTALGLEKIILVSHSAGTQIAYHYLLEYQEHIKNMILLGATDPKNGNSDFFSEDELNSFELARIQREEFYNRTEVQREINKLGLDRDNLLPKEQHQLRKLRSASSNIYELQKWREYDFYFINQDVANATQQSINWVYNHTELLAAQSFPITVINGEYDLIVGGIGSPIWKYVSEKEASNVDLVVIPKAGHTTWIDKPEEFKKELNKTLQK